MPRHAFINPGCCPAPPSPGPGYVGAPVHPVFLRLDADGKPEWVVLVYDSTTAKLQWTCAVVFCPRCGLKLPDVELNPKPPRPIMADADEPRDGYYCATCDERLHACQCLPPEFRYRVAQPGSDKRISKPAKRRR